MYEVIVNGHDEDDHEQTAKDIDFSLEDERWWQDIKRLRRPGYLSASQELAHAADLLEAVTQWPIASFQHGRREDKPKRFAALQRMLRQTRSRTSVSDLDEAGTTIGMRSQRLPAGLLENDSDSSGSIHDNDDRDDEADDEAAVTESEAGVSGSNFDEYDLDASDEESTSDYSRPSAPLKRTQTLPSGTGIPFPPKKLDLRKSIWKGSRTNTPPTTATSTSPLRPHPNASASESVLVSTRRASKARSAASSSSALSASTHTVQPPSISSEQSLPKFTSKPVPRTAVAREEATGPSIMFVATPAASRADPFASTPTPTPTPPSPQAPGASASASASTSTAAQPPSNPTPALASGFPSQQAIPLSFNDLPCRAQHLILNELMRSQSEDTAVLFTTLPSPLAGTADSEAESVKYISDLEVLTQGLPPVLLVHSNSMTVTMNL
jgi:potassium/chloride transporter 9